MRRGFTLIEILVVVAVIAILAGLSLAAFSGVQGRANKTATTALIQTLKQKIDAYANDFGDFPPSSAKRAGLTSNGINDGVETLVRCLMTTRKSGPYYQVPEDKLLNTDGDSTQTDGTAAAMTSAELFEVVDAWGRPLVYLHNKDYAKGQDVHQAAESGWATVRVTGQQGGKTGQYHALTEYQIISLGPDGKLGGDDDIGSWE